MPASRFERLLFAPFLEFQNGLVSPKVDVSGCGVVQNFVVSLMNVVIDEGFDPGFAIVWQEVVFQQDPILQGFALRCAY